MGGNNVTYSASVFYGRAHFDGFKAALPIILGACLGAAGIVLIVGSGVGQSLAPLPEVHVALQGAGVAWLSYLVWQIFRAPAQAMVAQSTQKRLGMIGGASLQWVNPTTWLSVLI